MITPYFNEHYNNWNIKVNGIVGDDLGSVFDRYITLFVIYNNLYNEVPAALIARGIPLPNQLYDNKKATEYVVNFLGAPEILNNLQANGCNGEIQAVIELIDHEEFHIKLNYGEHQRNEDLKILRNLRSTNEVNKAVAVLQVCYYVRCNMFHGSKDFHENQRRLVTPLTNIIRPVVVQLFNALTN
jgi:hypothetical protein